MFSLQRGLRQHHFEGSGGRGEDGVERGVERVERGFHDDGARGEGGVCARRRGVVFAGVANVGVLLWCGGGRFEGGDV